MARLGIPAFVAALLSVAAMAAAMPTLPPEKAVANMEKSLKAAATLQARFEQVHYAAALSSPLRERGEIFYEKPDRMRWDYKDPQDKVFLYKSGILEMYIPEDKQLIRRRLDDETMRSEIFGIFFGTMSFDEAYVIEDAAFPTASTEVQQVKLTPRTEGEYSHILLEIDRRTWLLRRAVFIEWAGGRREFVFSRIRTGVRIPARVFELRVPPDVEIIDEGRADSRSLEPSAPSPV